MSDIYTIVCQWYTPIKNRLVMLFHTNYKIFFQSKIQYLFCAKHKIMIMSYIDKYSVYDKFSKKNSLYYLLVGHTKIKKLTK